MTSFLLHLAQVAATRVATEEAYHMIKKGITFICLLFLSPIWRRWKQ